MTTRTQCPDCWQGLQPGASSCRCGWSEPAKSWDAAEASVPTLRCSTASCGEPAFVRDGEANVCRRCYEGRHHNEAFERCKAMGLNSVDDMRAYCRGMLKKGIFAKPSFERWAETIKQAAVDRMALIGSDSDLEALERLRAMCVIDAQDKVVPVERREALRAEREAKIRAERERVEAVLKSQAKAREPDREEAA